MSSKYQDIAEILIREVLEGQYRAGERMPSERDLAGRFNVNRGSVREALKSLEQIGLVAITPGGTRVKPLQEASLDVISHLLTLRDLPDVGLVEQMLAVINSLVSLAAEAVARQASNTDLKAIRTLLHDLLEGDLDTQAHGNARLELMRVIMELNGNLVSQLIARALLTQFQPALAPVEPFIEFDREAYDTRLRLLDAALERRDTDAVRASFVSLAEFNRQMLTRAVEAAATHRRSSDHPFTAKEVAAS